MFFLGNVLQMGLLYGRLNFRGTSFSCNFATPGIGCIFTYFKDPAKLPDLFSGVIGRDFRLVSVFTDEEFFTISMFLLFKS